MLYTISMGDDKPQIIDFNTFTQLDLRAGQVISAEPVKQSSKLIIMQVDFGSLGQKQVLAGLQSYYQPEELIGKQFVFVVNLPPKKMAGLESQAMILAVDDNHQVILITPIKPVTNGAKIR